MINALLIAFLWLITEQWIATVDAFIASHKDYSQLRYEVLAAPAQAISHVCEQHQKTTAGLLQCTTDLYWWRANRKTNICEDLDHQAPTATDTAVRRRYHLVKRCALRWPIQAQGNYKTPAMIAVQLPALSAELIR